MKPRTPRSFTVRSKTSHIQHLLSCFGSLNHLLKTILLRRIKIHNHEIRFIRKLDTVIPWIKLNTAQIYKIPQRILIIAYDILNLLIVRLRKDMHRFYPRRSTFSRILMIKTGTLNTVGKAVERLRPILQVRQYIVAHRKIIINQITLCNFLLLPVEFIEIG